MSKEDVDGMIEVREWSDSRKGSQAKESRQPPDTSKRKTKRILSPISSKRNEPSQLLSFSPVKLTLTSGL